MKELKVSGAIKVSYRSNEDLRGKSILIVEDYVDTGASMDYLIFRFKTYEPASISIATFASFQTRKLFGLITL